jgi:hypothetical protein
LTFLNSTFCLQSPRLFKLAILVSTSNWSFPSRTRSSCESTTASLKSYRPSIHTGRTKSSIKYVPYTWRNVEDEPPTLKFCHGSIDGFCGIDFLQIIWSLSPTERGRKGLKYLHPFVCSMILGSLLNVVDQFFHVEHTTNSTVQFFNIVWQ